jgi:hypothetical protein
MGYILCCNAQVNLIVIFVTCTCIALHSLFCQLPNYNLFTQHDIYLYGETPLVNCGPRSILLHILLSTASTVYFPQALLFLLTANKYHLPHDTFNPLLSANRWDWQPHCKLGQSILVVLCVGSTLLLAPTSHHRRLLLVSFPKSASNNLWEWFLSPTGRLNLGIITEGRFTDVLIIPYSWGFPTGPVRHQDNFLAPLPGRKRIPVRGVSHFQSF